MRKRLGLLVAAALPLAGAALEVQPWFGDVYEFHLLTGYSYSWFSHVQGSQPPFDEYFHLNLGYLGLDFSPSPEWSVDFDFQVAESTKQSFNFRTMAAQGRYLWFDDIVGDPISFATGASARFTPPYALRDVSCPSHGVMDFELNFALGKEFGASLSWLWRVWFFGALGQANRGSPWVRGIASLETNVNDVHKFALWAHAVNGYGRHTHIDVDNFYGYAKVREKAIDIGFRYGVRLSVWGTLRFEYIRRVLAKAAPQNENTLMISYLLPFSL